MERLFQYAPYELNKESKTTVLLERLNMLTEHHYNHCDMYKQWIERMFDGKISYENLEDIPFVPG